MWTALRTVLVEPLPETTWVTGSSECHPKWQRAPANAEGRGAWTQASAGGRDGFASIAWVVGKSQAARCTSRDGEEG